MQPCKFLLNEIAFYKDTIRPCCSFSIEGDITPFVNDYNGDIDGIKRYLEKRQEFIEIFKGGGKNEAPVCYKNCTTYVPSQNDNESFKLNNIIISNQTKCSCNCIYCEQAAWGKDVEYKKWVNSRKPYDIKPLLLYLRDNNYIEKNCLFLICGGECSEYPTGELEWLVYFAKSTEGRLLILSSGIIYSTAIENALKSNDSILKISIDSGTKLVYEQIKRVKAYDITWGNIRKYIEIINKTHDCNSNVELKYIIIPGINDNKEELNAFYEKCKEVNCRSVILDVEHQWIKENKNNQEKENNLKIVLNYFLEILYNDKNINYSYEGVEENWLWSLTDDKYNFKKQVSK